VINDTELLRQYSEHHSEQAFAALVQRYLNLVYFAALRRTNGDAHLAEDITQQVFAALAADAAKLRRHTVLAGWLYVTTRHAAANAMRSEKRRLNREQEAQAMQETQTASNLEADWNQLRPQLDCAIDELSKPDRLAVLLRFFENRPFAEIGATLRVSEDAARVRVDRALDKLRALLVRRGITSTAAALAVALTNQSTLAVPPALVASVTGFALTSTAVGAGGSATAAAGVMHFMSTTKVVIASASALAALALGTAVYEVREARQVQTALVASAQENVSLRERLQREAKRADENEKNLHSAEALAASLQKSVGEIEAGKNTTAQAKPTAIARSASSQMDLLLTNLHYQELAAQEYHSSLRFLFGPLYRKLGLNTQQIADFETAKAEQQQAQMDVFAAARAESLTPADPRLALLNDTANKVGEDRMRSALGDAGYEQYKAYAKTAYSRASVDSLASALYYTEVPLTAGQADQLTTLVAVNTGKTTPPGADGISLRAEIDWANVSVQAKYILAPSQLEVLQALAERDRVQQQVSALTRKLTDAAIAVPPSAVGTSSSGKVAGQ